MAQENIDRPHQSVSDDDILALHPENPSASRDDNPPMGVDPVSQLQADNLDTPMGDPARQPQPDTPNDNPTAGDPASQTQPDSPAAPVSQSRPDSPNGNPTAGDPTSQAQPDSPDDNPDPGDPESQPPSGSAYESPEPTDAKNLPGSVDLDDTASPSHQPGHLVHIAMNPSVQPEDSGEALQWALATMQATSQAVRGAGRLVERGPRRGDIVPVAHVLEGSDCSTGSLELQQLFDAFNMVAEDEAQPTLARRDLLGPSAGSSQGCHTRGHSAGARSPTTTGEVNRCAAYPGESTSGSAPGPAASGTSMGLFTCQTEPPGAIAMSCGASGAYRSVGSGKLNTSRSGDKVHTARHLSKDSVVSEPGHMVTADSQCPRSYTAEPSLAAHAVPPCLSDRLTQGQSLVSLTMPDALALGSAADLLLIAATLPTSDTERCYLSPRDLASMRTDLGSTLSGTERQSGHYRHLTSWTSAVIPQTGSWTYKVRSTPAAWIAATSYFRRLSPSVTQKRPPPEQSQSWRTYIWQYFRYFIVSLLTRLGMDFIFR